MGLLTRAVLTNRWISQQLEEAERARRREAAALAEWTRQQQIAAGRGVVGVAPPALALEGGNQLAVDVEGACAGGETRGADTTAKPPPPPPPPCRSPLAPLNRTGGFGTAAKAAKAASPPAGPPVAQGATALPGPTGPPSSTPAHHATQREVTPAKYSQRVDRARAANKQRIACSAKSPAIHPLGLSPHVRCPVSPRC